jgi:hypothetical protein
MARPSRTPANSLLHTAKEALKGPSRCESGATPGQAFPCPGTFSRSVVRLRGTSTQGVRVGIGARTTSAGTAVIFNQRCRASRQQKHSAIAICTACVLNSPKALIASSTGRLTRHDRRTIRGRFHADTPWGTRCSGDRTLRQPATSRQSGRRSPHREKLRGIAPSGGTALS